MSFHVMFLFNHHMVSQRDDRHSNQPYPTINQFKTIKLYGCHFRILHQTNKKQTNKRFSCQIYFLLFHVQEQLSDPIYDGCGETKTCFGFPDNCVSTKSCRAITAVTVRGERYEFELKTAAEDNARYVAVGLSEDTKMGDDSVVECVRENGRIQPYASWTTPRPNLGNTRRGVVSFAVKMTVCVFWQRFSTYEIWNFSHKILFVLSMHHLLMV